MPFGFPRGPSSRISNKGGAKLAKGVDQIGNTLCPFKCNLDCAAFGCSSLAFSSRGVAPRRDLIIHYQMAGANDGTKSRMMRLCVHSIRDDMAACRGGLHKFRHIRLGPNRDGRVSFVIAPTSLRLLGLGGS